MATKSATVSSVIALASLFFLIVLSLNSLPISTAVLLKDDEGGGGPFFVKKGERETKVSTEDGEVSAIRISDGIDNGRFHIESITLEPNAIFLPVLLQSEMVFYVHTGSGNMSWTDESETKQLELEKGDIYRLEPGTVFYIESSSSSSSDRDSQKLRIYAFFANAENDLHEPAISPYSSIRNLILGFDKGVLGAAFGVTSEAIEEITGGADPGGIVHGLKKEKKSAEREFAFMRALLVGNGYIAFFPSENNKKTKLFNVFSNEPDFENCNGWSTVVSKKQLSALKGIDISVFMVNLTKGSMMGPHWNPRASEFGICLHGQGMVKVVCPSSGNQTRCKNMRFHVEEGDVFAVPRFHPMAQVAFNNDSFVFMGFSTAAKNNHPQYLAGKASVLRTLDTDIVSISLNAKNTTLEKILNQQEQAIILECTSCAEEEFKVMKEEIQKEKEEEARKKKEEEKKKKEEEEKKKKEEEEKKKKEEEERRKEEREKQEKEREKEEEARKRREEEARREEEEAKKKEEQRRQEEEAARREEEAKKREEQRQKEEEAAREAARREEEAKKREEQRQKEEEAARREEEARKKEEEAKKKEEQRQKEEEAAREAARREEEARKEKEEAKKKEEQRQKEEEEAAREAARREEEARSQEEAAKEKEEQRQKEEEAAGEASRREEEAKSEKEEAKKREEEEAQEAARQEEEKRREEAARKEEEERREEETRQKEEEKAKQHKEEQEEQDEGGGWEWGEEGPGMEWGRKLLKKKTINGMMI